jgi:O-antigen/teichoic acid export membrane protein
MAWFFLSHIAAAALTLISFLVMTRVLSPEGFGAYNVIVLSATTAYFFLLAWVPTSVHRFHSAKEFSGRASAAAFGGGGIVLLVALPVLVVGQLFAPEGWRVPLLLGGLFWLTHSINEAGLSGLRVLGEGPRFAAAVVLRPLVGTILAITLATIGYGFAGAIVGMAIGATFTGLYVMVHSVGRLKIALPPLGSLRSFLGFGLPLAFVSSASTVVVLITQTVLAQGTGLAAVGIYAAAQTLALRGITMPMAMLSNAVAASIFHAYEVEGDAAADRALDRHFSFLMLVGLPIAGVMALSNDTVTSLLFEDPFRDEVSRYLPILAFAAFISGVQGAYFDYPFLISRRTNVQLLVTGAVVVAHAIIAFGLIWALGPIGACWAILASAVLALALYRRVGQRFREMRVPREELRKTAIGFVVFAPFALLADYLGRPVLSPTVAALAVAAYVITLAAQDQIAAGLIAARLRRSGFAARALGGLQRLRRNP